MAKQHVFIKSNTGLETFIKSEGLEDTYIDTYLRPTTNPFDIYYLENSKSSDYIRMVPLSDGGIVISSGCKRKTEPHALLHSYCVPRQEVENLVKTPGALCTLAPKDILSAGEERDLIALAKPFNVAEKLAGLSISLSEYLTILAAVFAGKEENRNVFIAYGKNTSLKDARNIIKCIYSYLPYYLRSHVGYTTFFRDSQISDGVSLYFVPKDSIVNYRDMSCVGKYTSPRDYIFNLNDKNYVHISDLHDDMAGDYISLVSNSILSGKDISPFFELADEAGRFLPHEKKLSLRFYDDLAYIFTLNDKEDTIISRCGRVTVLFTELLKAGAEEKILEYYSHFLKVYRKAIKEKKIPLPLEILKRLVINYEFCPETQQKELYDIISLDLDLCMKTEDNENIFTHIDAMHACPSLYNLVISCKMAPSNRLINRYFSYLINQKKTVPSLMEFVETVFSEMPDLAENDTIKSMLYSKGAELYDSSGDRFGAVKYIETKSEELSSEFPKMKELPSAIYSYAIRNYMSDLDMFSLNCSQISRFPLRDAETIDEDCTLKHRMILALKEILALTDDAAMSFVHYDSFGFENVSSHLSDDTETSKFAESQLKNKLYDCIKSKKESPRLILYAILYYIFENRGGRVKVDFDSIYAFIDKELNIPPFEFIKWFLSSNLYMTPMIKNGKKVRECSLPRADLTTLTAFYESTRKYFIGHGDLLSVDRNIRKLKKELDSVSSNHPDYKQLTDEFKKVLRNVVQESYPPFKRVFNRIVSAKNFKFIALVSLIFTIFAVGMTLGSITRQREVIPATENKDVITSNIDRTGWSSVKHKLNGNVLKAPGCIDMGDKTESLVFASDSFIEVSFMSDSGLLIDGISVSVGKSAPDVSVDVYLRTNDDILLLVNVSDYDIQTGAAIYMFPHPIETYGIVLKPKQNIKEGFIMINDVNALVIPNK